MQKANTAECTSINIIRKKKNETNQSVKSERHNFVGIVGDNSRMCRGMLEILCGSRSGDIHLHIVDVCSVRRSNGRTEHLVDKTSKGAKEMKKLLIAIVLIVCLGVFVGCSTYKIRDDYHYETMTIYFKDGENISFRRNDIKISQTDTLLIIDKKNDRSYVYKKENIRKIIYA